MPATTKKKRKPYEVVTADGSLGHYHSITTALVRAYKVARRKSRTVHIWRGSKWLLSMDGA